MNQNTINRLIRGIDARAIVTRKLPAHPVLPFVSRQALARVRGGHLPPPTACDCCGGPVILSRNRVLYGKDFGEWPFCYRCPQCQAYVGLHPQTDLPLGTMCDRATREARKRVKSYFMAVARVDYHGNRSAAYAALADAMQMDLALCHFGLFDLNDCERAYLVMEQVSRRAA